jgi:hypothetical protein
MKKFLKELEEENDLEEVDVTGLRGSFDSFYT